MEEYILKSDLVAEVEKRIKETESMQPKFDQFWAGQISAFKGVLKILETIEVKDVQEEPVSEELIDVAKQYVKEHVIGIDKVTFSIATDMFVSGAKWQKAHNWKPADGDDLPIIDREVIALLDNGKVVFAHRPPEYWDGKNIVTGKVTRNYPKTYDKGGWNIPNVKYWLDCSMPKEIEL